MRGVRGRGAGAVGQMGRRIEEAGGKREVGGMRDEIQGSDVVEQVAGEFRVAVFH